MVKLHISLKVNDGALEIIGVATDIAVAVKTERAAYDTGATVYRLNVESDMASLFVLAPPKGPHYERQGQTFWVGTK